MKRWILVLLVACACPSKKPPVPSAGSGSSAGTGSAEATPTTCEDVRPRIEQLYRTEALAKEPKRVDEAVADNTKMVMTDCAKNPARFVPCLANAASVAELEKQCLVPLDDEGTEGEPSKR
ncbi:MAG: hypothetical protein JWO36_6962 [Myxococcales bacterium]|nr:hypothetical protein [Myxococcales bacterium]